MKQQTSKEISAPPVQSSQDNSQRLSSIEKIISSESLSYLPNLYFRQYKLIQSLNHERYDFPQQKILVPRSKTSWDAVLCEMKQKSELRKEVMKYKKAYNYHISKSAKQQFIKKQLKTQERQLYHRIIANQLSSNVRQYFQSFIVKQKAVDQLNGKQKEGDINKKQEKGRQIDDIFIDKQAEDDFLGLNGQGDIFDDILNDQDHQRESLNGINDNHRQNQKKKRKTISQYIQDFTKINLQNQNKIIQEIDQENQSTHISRKSCFKKINQNLRKRLKSKNTQTQDRSLTSATVALSILINNYPECKNVHKFIQIPSTTQWIFDDLTKTKRKKDQQFQLKWDKQQIQKFKQMNQKFQISKIEDLPTLLRLTVNKNQYPKLFEKNISTNYKFPPNIQSITPFSKKFDKKTFYYNQFHEESYQRFVMKNNKRKLLQKFEKNSNYIFPQHYVQDQIENNQKLNTGKMFLYPPNKVSNRIIYKIQPGMTKITAIAKDYNKKNLPFSRQKVILMTFLVNKYLAQFGNNWKAITQFIEIFPCFSNYLIKPQLVQQLYQMVNRHQLKQNYLSNLQIWDKKILPSKQLSFENYKNFQKITSTRKKKFRQEDITQQQSGTLSEQDNNQIDLDDYQRQINDPLDNQRSQNKIFSKLSKSYKAYGDKLYATTTNDTYNFYQNKVRKANKIIEEYRNTYGVTKVQPLQRTMNQEKTASQYVQQYLKGQIKSGLPFRKKKNINQRNNQLVKILQALRTKNVGPTASVQSSSGMNKMPPQMMKPMANPQKIIPPQQQPNPSSNTFNAPIVNNMNPPPTIQIPQGQIIGPPSVALVNKPSQVSQGDKQQKKSKTPQKRVGGVTKKKKKEGQQQKKV